MRPTPRASVWARARAINEIKDLFAANGSSTLPASLAHKPEEDARR